MTELEKLATELGAALAARGFMLVLAESCTGGMAAEAVTSIAGSSAWFDRAFITYSNQAKVDMLGVSNQTLLQYGAVSEQTAAEMAEGALKFSLAQISASITGIAGPDGGTADKPVGTVCFGFALKSSLKTSISTSTQYFTGSRESVRQQATIYAITQLLALMRAA